MLIWLKNFFFWLQSSLSAMKVGCGEKIGSTFAQPKTQPSLFFFIELF